MTLQKELTHQWEDCDLEGVEFLKYPHRHMFHIEAEIVVSKNDDSREIEIILAKRAIEKFIDESYPDILTCRAFAFCQIFYLEFTMCSFYRQHFLKLRNFQEN